ncbi:hypothetical protein [Streptomyces cylindrosporus]|uniref:Tail terminator n=1 Tax=Streptomyces cylindrosporus TaxID=2927583 RepID=A0ABS9YEE7_9ACTN|nr:hypothetical protein [Streptomyces cylindrosporus]MCI3274976.1 hypothetical protein [Streptomyces cylindrosporus]
MADPTVTFPDVERLVVDFLTDRAELAAATVDNVPPAGFDGTQQVVLVSRSGGAWIDDQHLDTPLVDIEVYGPDKTTAHTLALKVRAALLALRGTLYGTASVTDVVEADGPRWLPDWNRSAANRYYSTVRLNIHAT